MEAGDGEGVTCGRKDDPDVVAAAVIDDDEGDGEGTDFGPEEAEVGGGLL